MNNNPENYEEYTEEYGIKVSIKLLDFGMTYTELQQEIINITVSGADKDVFDFDAKGLCSENLIITFRVRITAEANIPKISLFEVVKEARNEFETKLNSIL